METSLGHYVISHLHSCTHVISFFSRMPSCNRFLWKILLLQDSPPDFCYTSRAISVSLRPPLVSVPHLVYPLMQMNLSQQLTHMSICNGPLTRGASTQDQVKVLSPSADNKYL